MDNSVVLHKLSIKLLANIFLNIRINFSFNLTKSKFLNFTSLLFQAFYVACNLILKLVYAFTSSNNEFLFNFQIIIFLKFN